MIKNKTSGFSLVEILIVLAIMAILSAVSIPTMIGFVEDTKGKRYIPEARLVAEAVQMHLLDENPDSFMEMFMFTEDLTSVPVTNKNHVLYQMLEGSCTEGAQITGVTRNKSTEQINGIQYTVNGYEIEIDFAGESVIVTKKDNKGSAMPASQ